MGDLAARARFAFEAFKRDAGAPVAAVEESPDPYLQAIEDFLNWLEVTGR